MKPKDPRIQQAKGLYRKYKRVVIWGINEERPGDSLHFIFQHFIKAFEAIDQPVLWVDDYKKNTTKVKAGDLVLSVNVTGKHLPEKAGVDYCLHNYDEIGNIHDRLDPRHNIRLQVYTNKAEKADERWEAVTLFDNKTRTLFQPWGTDLLPWQFKRPVYPFLSRDVFWVGSIWDNELGQGNEKDIQLLKKALTKHQLRFHHMRVDDEKNVRLMRLSRIAPAIAGQWQVDNNYLPCRMFKNISYGQLGITNVPKFRDLFLGCALPGRSIGELVDNALGLRRGEWIKLVKAQQAIVKRHTYLDKIINIAKALEKVRGQ